MTTFEKKLRAYRAQVYIHTDHKPLVYILKNVHHGGGIYARWASYLESFHAAYVYLPGKDNVAADYFSRVGRHAEKQTVWSRKTRKPTCLSSSRARGWSTKRCRLRSAPILNSSRRTSRSLGTFMPSL